MCKNGWCDYKQRREKIAAVDKNVIKTRQQVERVEALLRQVERKHQIALAYKHMFEVVEKIKTLSATKSIVQCPAFLVDKELLNQFQQHHVELEKHGIVLVRDVFKYAWDMEREYSRDSDWTLLSSDTEPCFKRETGLWFSDVRCDHLLTYDSSYLSKNDDEDEEELEDQVDVEGNSTVGLFVKTAMGVVITCETWNSLSLRLAKMQEEDDEEEEREEEEE